MSYTPLVSILIPIYKVEQYLVECLDSCLKQTYRNIEIIAVNDGSPDRCGEIIDSYAKIDSRFIHIRKENQGLPLARMTAMEHAKGDYVLYLDGDDFFEINSVERYVRAALSSGADMVYSDAYRWSDEGGRSEVYINPKNLSTENGIEYLESCISTFIWGKLYKREVTKNLIPQRTNVSEDVFFNLQILPRCQKVVYIKEHLYYYRINPSSIMNSRMQNIALQYLEHAMQRRDLLQIIDFPRVVKDWILYDNIRVIYRYFKHVGINEHIMSLVNITFKEYRFPIFCSFKVFKMSVFLVFARFTPKFAKLLTHK